MDFLDLLDTPLTLLVFLGGIRRLGLMVSINSGADMNCIQEGLIPSKYFEKTKEKMTSATGFKLQINYKLLNAYIYNNEYCFKNIFTLVKNLKQQVILGTPFLTQIYSFTVNSKGIYSNIPGK